MAGRAGDGAVLREPRIEVELSPERDAGVRRRVVFRDERRPIRRRDPGGRAVGGSGLHERGEHRAVWRSIGERAVRARASTGRRGGLCRRRTGPRRRVVADERRRVAGGPCDPRGRRDCGGSGRARTDERVREERTEHGSEATSMP